MDIKITIIIAAILIIFCCPVSMAQQTIIIVPSPDVLKKGQIYPRVADRFRPFQPGSYEFVIPSLVYGLSNTSEIYLGVSGFDFPDVVGENLDISFKKIVQITDTTRFTIGNRMAISLRVAQTPVNFSYAHLSQQIVPTKTRLTAGIYTLSGEHFFPDRTGALLGFEQFIIPNKVQLVVDWISRQESISFLGAGFKFRPSPRWVIATAVLIPNGSENRVGFVVFAGRIFR